MRHFDPSTFSNTYSIVARDPETGEMGVAVQTHQMGVGRLVPWMLPGIGAIATQSATNVSYGPMGLSMLQEGVDAEMVVKGLTATDKDAPVRQLAVVDTNGGAYAFTGDACIPEAGHHIGEGYTVQANMMTRNTVVDAMREAFEFAQGTLSERMIATLRAAQAEDGDIRGTQSAALQIVSGDRTVKSWERIYDLRVDEHHNPVEELARLEIIRRAQIINTEGYVLLADGNYDEGLKQWTKARALSPDQEELGFWQAIALTDRQPVADSVNIAAQIFNECMQNEPRRDAWLDLIRRLETCGRLERENAADELLSAIKALE